MDFSRITLFFSQAFKPGQTIGKKTAQGTLWLFLLRLADQGLNLLKTIILVRLLSPYDFGLFGVAFIALSVAESFSQTGFQQALIQKKEAITGYLDTAWVIQITRGIFLALLLFFGAPVVAHVFGEPAVIMVLQVSSVALLLQGFANIGVIYFQRDIELNKYFAYQGIGMAVDFAMAVTFGLVFKNVWALVAGFIAGDAARLLVSYVLHRYRPRFLFSMAKARELFHFGKWVFGSNMLYFFTMQSDSMVIGRMLGAANLGLYQVGNKIASITGTEVVAGAIMPAYAKIQHDLPALGRAYQKTVALLVFFIAPVAAGVVAVAGLFTELFFGPVWMDAVPVMQALAVSGSFWALAVVSAPLFLAVGRPDIETKYNLFRLALLLVFLYPCILAWGIVGAAWAVLASIAVSSLAMVAHAGKLVGVKFGNLVRPMAFPAALSACMAYGVFQIQAALPHGKPVFFLAVAAGVALYGLFAAAADRWLQYPVIRMVKEAMALFTQ